MLELVPFARAVLQVANGKPDPQLIGQKLQLLTLQIAEHGCNRFTAVGGDQRSVGCGIALTTANDGSS